MRVVAVPGDPRCDRLVAAAQPTGAALESSAWQAATIDRRMRSQLGEAAALQRDRAMGGDPRDELRADLCGATLTSRLKLGAAAGTSPAGGARFTLTLPAAPDDDGDSPSEGWMRTV